MDNSHEQPQRNGGKPFVDQQAKTQNLRQLNAPSDYQNFKESTRSAQPQLKASERRQDGDDLRWNQARPHQSALQNRTDFRPGHQGSQTPRQSNGTNVLRPPPPVSIFSGRHLSHISALSSAQPSVYSRPVSEVSTEGTSADALTQKDRSANTGDIKSFSVSPSRVPRSKSRSGASTNGSPSKYIPATKMEPMPSMNTAATMEALTSAIREGLGPGKTPVKSATPQPFSNALMIRMPFQNEPGSPTSIYTEVTSTNNRDTLPLSSYHGYNPRESKPSTITEHEVEDYEKLQFANEVPTPVSQTSTVPVLQNEGHGMSSKIPESKRPLKLDIAAVREAEARGSMTSLSDLIKRATRLASNLDRGKTASRLGHLDMFGSHEKLDRGRFRNSTYSDVLAAFPPPADGTRPPTRERPATMWPSSGKQFMMSKSSLGVLGDGNESVKQKRLCCGLPPLVFILMLLVLFLLVAAAILIPVFLIVLPKQHQKTLGKCSSTHTCRNSGVAVLINGQCSCVCTGGFTGGTCSHESDPECTTVSVHDGINVYESATVGTALVPILQSEDQVHGVPLNKTIVLATFAANNLSCASENSLVVFNQISNGQKRRSLNVDDIRDLSGSALPAVIPAKQRRQDATQSANGIVFATSSQQHQPTAASNPVSITPSATGTVQNVASNDTLNFAAAVVLYVLQTNAEINAAVTAKQAMSAYFEEKNPKNHTVVVVGGPQRIAVDFDTFEINLANGTKLGGR